MRGEYRPRDPETNKSSNKFPKINTKIYLKEQSSENAYLCFNRSQDANASRTWQIKKTEMIKKPLTETLKK